MHMRILKISDQLLNKVGKVIKWKRDSRVSHKMHKLKVGDIVAVYNPETVRVG